jgi:hypothetical protein
MRRLLIGPIFIILATLLFVVPKTFASSQQAYQDYLYQADVYRQKYTEFQISKNEYLKFNTLASETDAISKTRAMLSQRSLLLRAYLLLLTEKVNETSGILPTEADLYHTYVKSEVSFLENHSQFVNSVQTIKDAIKASEQLEDHYTVLASSMRQISLGVSLAQLRSLGNEYSQSMVAARILIDQVRPELPLDKQTTIDRWFVQISNKRTMFLQKIDAITQAVLAFKGEELTDVDKRTTDIQNQLATAQKDIVEGISYIKELTEAMRYKD